MMKIVCDKCGKEACTGETYIKHCNDNSGYFVDIQSEFMFEQPFHEELIDKQLCYDCYLSFLNWLKSGDE